MSGGGVRAARNLSAGAVAAIAAWSSYSHMVHVALSYHERPQVAYAVCKSLFWPHKGSFFGLHP